MKVKSFPGEILLESSAAKAWKIALTRRSGEEKGIEYVHLSLRCAKALPPPELKLSWTVPGGNTPLRWSTSCGKMRNIVPDWSGSENSTIARNSPLVMICDTKDLNHWTFAFSDALRNVRFFCGLSEETAEILCRLELFTAAEAPVTEYEADLRIDKREIYFGDAVRSVTKWYESMKEYKPCPVPAEAYRPFYSAWYSYHQNLFDKEILAESREAVKYGMNTIILDDGWQTDDNNRGYAFCGDWEMSKKRFPDFARHVRDLHKIGMKCMIWYSVPFVGFNSKVYKKFTGKFLYMIDGLKTSVLDPRFPEVRKYLTNIYVKALKEWDLDGFKLDFIDTFSFKDGIDPAAAENYRGRDIKSLPHAVDALLSGVMKKLTTLKPGLLIEFRQSYIGPAIRKYGNLFRAADCPADPLSNRIRTTDLRLSSGNTAVHSDMLMWHTGNETAEQAANQILSILFSVPQVSVRLAKIPARQKKMLKFWLDFCRENEDILLHGDFHPERMDLNYPRISSSNDRGKVTALYMPGLSAKADTEKGKILYLVNGTSGEGLLVDAARPFLAELFDTTGKCTKKMKIRKGLQLLPVPEAGLAVLK